MEQEPQRELQWYTLRRVAYWVRMSGRILFISLTVGLVIGATIVLMAG